MKVTVTKSLEIIEILNNIKQLSKIKNISIKQKEKLAEYKKAYSAYEESGESYYVDNFTAKLTFNDFSKFFTSKRLELINLMSKNNFDSISEISRRTKRDIKNIYDDLKILEKLGFISLNKNNKNISPKLKVESIFIDFSE